MIMIIEWLNLKYKLHKHFVFQEKVNQRMAQVAIVGKLSKTAAFCLTLAQKGGSFG